MKNKKKNNLIKYLLAILVTFTQTIVFVDVATAADKVYILRSPDKTIALNVKISDNYIKYSLAVDGQIVMYPSRIAMEISTNITLGKNPSFQSIERRSENKLLSPTVPLKSSHVKDHFNEMTLNFKGNYSLIFRTYNNGVSYRFKTTFPEIITIKSETIEYDFGENSHIYFPKEKGFQSHNERSYLYQPVLKIQPSDLASLPALIETKSIKILISETALKDYPGQWLIGGEKHKLTATFPKFALQTNLKEDSDRNEIVTQRAEFIAKTKGTRAYPWRFLALAREDADLITNQLSYLLADPLQIKDPSWIKPGKVSWDWWNYNNLYGVNFKAGVNTQTYKYYIDFASQFGLDYIIMDEGWYKLGNVFDVVPEIDIEEIIAYGKEKDVGVILWVIWKTLDVQLEEAMDQFEKWGAAGLKIDFMQRDDQWMVNYYWRMAEAAAKRKLLVNFHGAYKPAGLRRAYPNVLTREGVKGSEHNKWSKDITPSHNLTIPFIRMVAGPMDYTPGAMVNSSVRAFASIFPRPMSMGTRTHQLAMFVVYESPMQMLSDSPSNYLREIESTTFISKIPTVWDETKVLSAEIGKHIILARRKGEIWFIGAMTNEESREMEIDLTFLENTNFKLTSFEDGINADRYASDYHKKIAIVNADTKLTIKMVAGGGWVGRLEPECTRKLNWGCPK